MSKLVRYCFECGTIGEELAPGALACCPDSHHDFVRVEIAEQARTGFLKGLSLVETPVDGLREVREWVNDLPIPRPKGTTRISMVIAQAMKKLGIYD